MAAGRLDLTVDEGLHLHDGHGGAGRRPVQRRLGLGGKLL